MIEDIKGGNIYIVSGEKFIKIDFAEKTFQITSIYLQK